MSGSPHSSSAPSKPGSVAVSGLRPPPGARTRSDTGAPSTSSAMPLLMVSGCNLLVRQPGPHHPALSHVPQPGHQPPLPLVQVRKHAPELLTQNLIRPTSHSHAGTLSPQTPKPGIDHYRPLRYVCRSPTLREESRSHARFRSETAQAIPAAAERLPPPRLPRPLRTRQRQARRRSPAVGVSPAVVGCNGRPTRWRARRALQQWPPGWPRGHWL